MRLRFLPFFLMTLCLLAASPARAGLRNRAPIAPFAADKIKGLAPLLRSSDLAVIESDPAGRFKQASIFTLVAAPPELVREVLLAAERYPDFVRNLSSARVVKPSPGASEAGFDLVFSLSYGLFSVEATDRYVLLPPDPEADAPPVQVYDPSEAEGGTLHHRWEFYRVAGATVLAHYGYTDVMHGSGMVRRVLERAPQLEHGFAVASQLAMVLAMKARAEQIMGAPPLMPASGSAPYDFLLDRGTVVLLRSQNGRLSETSLIERSSAPADALLTAVQKTGEWPRSVPTITQVTPIETAAPGAGAESELPRFELRQELPLLSWRTRYLVRALSSSVDMLGTGGDLAGSRLRFDVSALRPAPGPSHAATSQIVLRASQQYDKGSLLIRQLYKVEPLFEYGVNVGMQLMLLRGLRQHAEKTTAQAQQHAQVRS